jgi:hypothetical protein
MATWQWKTCPETLALFIDLLLRANHENGFWKGHEVKRGQLITGRKSLSKSTGLSEQAIRTSLERLKSTNEITIKSTNKFSIITICKYDDYQTTVTPKQPAERPATQPTNNQQTTTNKNDKNDKNINTKKLDPSVLAYPSNLDTPAVRKAVSDWLEHKQGLGKTYKRNRSVEILLKQWASRGPQAFCEAVDHSIGQNYAGVFSPPPKRTTSNGNGIYPEKKALVANYGSLLTEEE